MKLRTIALAGLAALAAGCVDNNASLKWGPICTPTEDCTFSSTCDAQYIGPVEVQAASTNPYLMLVVEVANQRPTTENLDQGQLDTATAYIHELVIENDLTGAEVIMPVAFVVPSTGTAVIVVSITRPTASATYLVRMRGAWGDETTFESAALVVPVTVCGGAAGPACLYVQTCAVGGCPVPSGQAPIACGA